jgi:hypothetical protein
MSMIPRDYGKYYWFVMLNDVNKTEVYFHADELEVTDSGALVAVTYQNGEKRTFLSFAGGYWIYYYAASAVTGDPVNVQRWAGVYEYEDTR